MRRCITPLFQHRLSQGAFALILALGCFNSKVAAEDEVIRWTEKALVAIRAANSPPTLASRNLAILHSATYDAINSITRTHQPYRFQATPPGGSSIQAAAAGAAHTILTALYPQFQSLFDEEIQRQLGALPSSVTVSNGIDFGQNIGRWALDSRKADGSSSHITYIPSDAVGQWRRTPPLFWPPLDPHWGNVTPFCLEYIGEFLPPGPPPVKSPEYAAEWNEVYQLGRRESTVRTQEQSVIASFWSDFNYTVTPPGHWQQIAIELAKLRGNTLVENARMFALLSLAQADAAIVTWDAKYRFNFWRPVTAIHRADEDDNPATDKDSTWESLLTAPPFPEYPSGHSTFSAASAAVLAEFFGSSAIAFSVGSDSLPGVQRHFRSLWECAEEVGMSRIYGGIHFASANRDGKASGRRIGNHVFKNFLLPNSMLPSLTMTRANSGSVMLRLHGQIGISYTVEESRTVSDWRPFTSLQAIPGGTVLVIESPFPDVSFYRAIRK